MTSNPASPARGLPRPLLWVLFAIAVTANAITSVSSLPAVVGAAFGVVAIALGALLVRDHLRRRASSRRSPDRL
jgi:uncharacterized membrane protein